PTSVTPRTQLRGLIEGGATAGTKTGTGGTPRTQLRGLIEGCGRVGPPHRHVWTPRTQLRGLIEGARWPQPPLPRARLRGLSSAASLKAEVLAGLPIARI